MFRSQTREGGWGSLLYSSCQVSASTVFYWRTWLQVKQPHTHKHRNTINLPPFPLSCHSISQQSSFHSPVIASFLLLLLHISHPSTPLWILFWYVTAVVVAVLCVLTIRLGALIWAALIYPMLTPSLLQSWKKMRGSDGYVLRQRQPALEDRVGAEPDLLKE